LQTIKVMAGLAAIGGRPALDCNDNRAGCRETQRSDCGDETSGGWSTELRRDLKQRLWQAGVYTGASDAAFGEDVKLALDALVRGG